MPAFGPTGTYTSRMTGSGGGITPDHRQQSCGSMGCRLRFLVGKGRHPKEALELDGKKVCFTYLGRNAVWQAVRALDLRGGDEILVPSYNCGSEIDPLVHYGLDVVPYRVLRSTQIDVDDLEKRISDRTKAVYITHFFGFPQELDAALRLCGTRGLGLIEDCALGLFSRQDGVRLGMRGDVAVFSFRKTLPLPDGGALTLNDPKLRSTSPQECPPSGRVLGALLPLALRPLCSRLGFIGDVAGGAYHAVQRAASRLSRIHGRVDDAGPSHVWVAGSKRPVLCREDCYDHRTSKWMMSSISRRILGHINATEVVARRRGNFLYLLDALRAVPGLEPVFSALPDGICPVVFPVLTENRDELCIRLWKMKISAIAWWAGYHPMVNWQEFTDACYLKDHVTALPVHQDLDKRHMSYMARCVRDSLALSREGEGL